MTVASMDMYEFRGAAIRDDGAVAWFRYAFDGPPIIWFRELGQPERQITRISGGYAADLHVDQTTVSWTESGAPHSIPIN